MQLKNIQYSHLPPVHKCVVLSLVTSIVAGSRLQAVSTNNIICLRFLIEIPFTKRFVCSKMFPLPCFLICASLLGLVAAIDRDGCVAGIRAEIKNNTLSANNHSFFSETPASLDSSLPLYLFATVCRNQCGKGFTWYDSDEISGNIVGWLIPVLVLIGNMHMPPYGAKWKLFSLFHFIGDPVDSMLSLQHSLGVRHAAYAWAKETVTRFGLQVTARDLATVFWAFDTLNAGSERTPIEILTPLLQMKELPHAVVEAAADIRNNTVKEAARTYQAIVIYLCTVGSAFINSATNSTQCGTKPGNRIAFAMLFSWLLPAILLSTSAARFTTSDACQRAILRFTRHLNMPETSLLPTQYHSKILTHGTVTSSVQAAAPWSGAIYIYRQRKTIFRRPLPYFPSTISMLFLSIVPIIIAMFIAVAISYNTPTVGLGCRSIAEISFCLAWLCSFAFTVLLRKSGLITGKYHLLIIAVKDIAIGMGVVLAVAIIYAGAFNSCWCWSNGLSGVFSHTLYVELGTDNVLQTNAENLYPSLVGGGLGAQTFVFLLMWGGGWADKRWRGNGQKDRLTNVFVKKSDYQPIHRLETESGIPLVKVTHDTDHGSH